MKKTRKIMLGLFIFCSVSTAYGTNESQLTEFATCCYKGDVTSIKAILQKDLEFDVNCVIPRCYVPSEFKEYLTGSAITPLACAALGGHLSVIKCLLNKGAVLCNKKYQSSLYYAVRRSKENVRRYLNIVRYLVEQQGRNISSLRGTGVFIFADQEVKDFLEKVSLGNIRRGKRRYRCSVM